MLYITNRQSHSDALIDKLEKSARLTRIYHNRTLAASILDLDYTCYNPAISDVRAFEKQSMDKRFDR